jgi:hypothetical protein
MAKIRKFKVDEADLKSSAAKIGEGAKKERESGTASMMSDLSKRASKPAASSSSPAPKKQSFGSAFASARKSGAKTFTWNGKSYTTAVAGEKKVTAKTTPAKTESAKSYVPKGGTKMPGPTMAQKSAPSMLTRSAPNNSSAYSGPFKDTPKTRSSEYRGPFKSGADKAPPMVAAKVTPKAEPKKDKPRPSPAKPVSWEGAKPAGFTSLKSGKPRSSDYRGPVKDKPFAKGGKTRAGRK